MAGDAQTMEEKLRLLRVGYAEKLGARIDELESFLTQMVDADDDAGSLAALEQVRHHAHKLAGSGATFGFPDVSTLARKMERACFAVINGEGEYGQPLADAMHALCDQLRDAAKAPIDTAAEESAEIARAAQRRSTDTDQQKAVIVMECDEGSAAQMRLEMEHFGFDVRIIEHPSKLAAALDVHAPDVVVSGLSFGGDDDVALTVLNELRDAGEIHAPLVVHTGLDTMVARIGAVRAGAEAYLVKPVDMADLVDVLDTVSHRDESEPFRVLVVDDDESLAMHTELVLQGAGMETFVQTDPLKVLDSLDDFSPELLLLDLYMPQCSGEELAAVIRQREEYAGIPIVFLSGEADKDKQLSAMELGGDDFLTKPIRPAHLISSVRIRAARFRKLRSFMVRDSMTGLFNHTTTKQLLDSEISRSQRSGSEVVLASLDIDHFKGVNDTYGHSVGDRVIKALARLLRQRLRGADVIGRMGGEEFAAILPDTNMDEAFGVFEEIRTAFSDIQFHAAGHDGFNVTISCGLAAFPEHDTPAMLSDASDKALYVAKNSGRNQVVRAK
ncbi:diguanylate cyclase [Pseudomonadota bacterium]